MIKNLRYVFASLLMLVCGSAFAEDIIWQEDWSGVTEFKVDPSSFSANYTFTGYVLNDEDGSFKSGTTFYNESTAGGTAPELLIAKSGGSFTALVELGGKSGEMVLTFKTNRADLKVEVDGATMGDKQRTGNDDTYVLTVAEGTQQINITFKMETKSNARLDDIKLYQGTAKKPAGISWGKASTTVTIGQEFTLVLSNENNLPVTYTSSEPTVATIDEAGVITLVAAGKTTLTASFEGNDEYEAQSVSIEVTVKAAEGGGDQPGGDDEPGGGDQPGGDEATAVTIAEFNAAEVSNDVWYQLTGVIKNLKNGDQYGNFDLEDETGSVYVYGLLSEKGGAKKQFQDLVAQQDLKNGTTITLIGNRGVYNEKIEVMNAYFVRVDAQPTVEEPDPEDAIQGGTVDAPLTVGQALGYIHDFDNGFITAKTYYVKGIVEEVTEVSTDKGNITFKMRDDDGNSIIVFRVKGLENKSVETEDFLKTGDEVVVCAKLQKYEKDGAVTPELSQGYVYSLNGATKVEDGYVIQGDGSKENPYTVEDLQHMAVPSDSNPVEGQERVWVKGFIVGALNTSGSAYDMTVVSNIALGAESNETDAKKTIPVQLPVGNIRAALNVVDNADIVTKEVAVYGYILKYMGRTGVKNITLGVLDGNEIGGIYNVTIDATDATVYNLNGQRVEKAVRGLYIVNGKKVVIK